MVRKGTMIIHCCILDLTVYKTHYDLVALSFLIFGAVRTYLKRFNDPPKVVSTGKLTDVEIKSRSFTA